jgi:hypothetical protein
VVLRESTDWAAINGEKRIAKAAKSRCLIGVDFTEVYVANILIVLIYCRRKTVDFMKPPCITEIS